MFQPFRAGAKIQQLACIVVRHLSDIQNFQKFKLEWNIIKNYYFYSYYYSVINGCALKYVEVIPYNALLIRKALILTVVTYTRGKIPVVSWRQHELAINWRYFRTDPIEQYVCLNVILLNTLPFSQRNKRKLKDRWIQVIVALYLF